MNRLALFFLSFLAVGSVALTAYAQAPVPIFSFDVSGTNGAYPEANLTLGPDGNFYGTTEAGGTNNDGTVFKVTTGGKLTTLVNFNGPNGVNPFGALRLAPDGSFYGTTEYGGNNINSGVNNGLGGGTVFRVTTNGGLTTLATFAVTNGASPRAGLTWGPDGNLYGTTSSGGPNGDTYGTVFKMTIGGTLTSLTNFNSANGANPYAGLTLGPDGNFYGTTQSGGNTGNGTVFQVTTNGTLTAVFNFGTNNGISPQTGLTLGPDGNFYGTTAFSGLVPFTVFPGFNVYIAGGNGTVYRVTTNGAFTSLLDFGNYAAGVNPNASLTLGPDGNFYGTTYHGSTTNAVATTNAGTIFEVTTNGTLTTLANFDSTNGAYPLAGLTLGPDGNFYGTTSGGGAGAIGAVFKFYLSPVFLSMVGSGGGFTMSVESYPSSTNRIWATTNLALPSSWQVLGTITTDANGMGQFLDSNTTNIPAKYYRLSYP